MGIIYESGGDAAYSFLATVESSCPSAQRTSNLSSRGCTKISFSHGMPLPPRIERVLHTGMSPSLKTSNRAFVSNPATDGIDSSIAWNAVDIWLCSSRAEDGNKLNPVELKRILLVAHHQFVVDFQVILRHYLNWTR